MGNFIKSNKKKLQISVVIILLIFLSAYYFHIKTIHKNEVKPTSKIDNTVYIQNSIVHAFGNTISIANYPDRVSVHFPYLLIVKPIDNITNLYNLEQKTKEKDIQMALLDYSNGKSLYNHGKTTFLDKEDLKVLCEKGFIKSDTEILCITKISSNYRQNKLVSVSLPSLNQRDIYTSKNLITDIKVINDKIYMGEIDLNTNKFSVLIDKERVEVADTVSIIYEMNSEAYFASLKDGQKESYYLIEEKNVKKQDGNKIYLCRQEQL